MLRYDNERGKGDHRHSETAEEPYAFLTPDRLMSDFEADVARWNHENRLKALCGAGPQSIRELAQRVGRDTKAVHRDVTALLKAGVLSHARDRIEFPFDAVKVKFLLQAA